MKSLAKYQESLIENTTNSTASMNITTENFKELQIDLVKIIENVKNISSSNNVSLENISDTVKSLKLLMNNQNEVNDKIYGMLDKTVRLSEHQERYISKFNDISEIMSKSIEGTKGTMNKLNEDIAVFYSNFKLIKDSTLEAVIALENNYNLIADDIESANYSLSTTVKEIDEKLVVKVETMGNKIESIVDDLDIFQKNVANLTNKIESFAEVEETTQSLWKNYKGSFEELNETINDGVQSYTKLVSSGVKTLFTEYDSSIANAITNLKSMVETLNGTAENIQESLEYLEKQDR